MIGNILRLLSRRIPVANLTRSGKGAIAVPLCHLNQRYSSGLHHGKKTVPDQRAAAESLKYFNINLADEAVKNHLRDQAAWDQDKLKNLSHTVCLISQADLMKFFDYSMSGYRPDGGKPSFPLLTQEELELSGKPYHEWASEPFKNLGYSSHQRLEPLFMGTGDGRDLKNPPYADLPARLHPLFLTIWHGQVPMSQDRWIERRMDDPANWRILFELTRDILHIFEWFNNDHTQLRMRGAFNHLVETYVEFGSAANLRREQLGVKERLDMAGMCVEFYHNILTTASDRTHQWLVDRLDEVRNRVFVQYKAELKEAGDKQEAVGIAGKKYYECVQALNVMTCQVDYLLSVPMSGFKGYIPSGSVLELSLSIRQDIYSKLAKTKSWTYRKAILGKQKEDPPPPARPSNMVELVKEMQNGPPPAEPSYNDHEKFTGHYYESTKNLAEIRKAFRGGPTVPGEEYWISILKERMEFYLRNGKNRKTHRWGFVCYRLTYDQSEEDWTNFRKALETDVFKSGKWIEGYDTIADMAGIEYIDGRQHGIGEDDIDAAKKHFTSTYTMLPTPGRMWTKDFLVIDSSSYRSYTNPIRGEARPPPQHGPCFGDMGGFVRLVDTDQVSQEFLDAVSPGYQGSVNVLSSVLLEQLYPLLVMHAIRPDSLWPMARLHPDQVYVGHTVPSQLAWFESQRQETDSLISGFMKFLRQKKDGLAQSE